MTPRQAKNDDTSKLMSRTSKRADSASTRRTNGTHRMRSNTSSQTSDDYRSDGDHAAHFETNVNSKAKRLVKKKSMARGKGNRRTATSETDDSDTEETH